MGKRGEMNINRRGLIAANESSSPSDVEESEAPRVNMQGRSDSTPGIGPIRNASSSTRNLPKFAALNRIKRTILSLMRRENTNTVDKRKPQVLENAGLDPALGYIATSPANTLRDPLRRFGIMRVLPELTRLQMWILQHEGERPQETGSKGGRTGPSHA